MQNYRKSTINTAQAHTQAQLRGTQHRFPRATGQQNFRANGSESSFEQRNPWASQVPRAPVPSIQTPFTGQGQFSASSTQQVVRVGSPQPPVNIWQQRQLQQQQAATATVTSRPLKQQHQAPGVQVLPNPGGPYGVPQAELGHANAAAAKNNINQITQSIPQQQQQALAAANARRTPPSHQNPTAPPQNYNMMYQVQQQPPNQRPQQPNQQYNMAAAQRQGMGQPPPSSQMGAGPRQQRPPQQMGQQQQPPNMTSTAGGIPYNTTMFMQGPQPPQFISGAPSVITITGQHPPQMHIDPYNMQQQYNQQLQQQLGGGQPRMPTFMPTGFNPAAGPPGGAPGQYGQPPPMFHPSYTASQPVAGAALQQPAPQPASQQPPQPTAPGKDTMPRQPTNTVYYGGGPNQGGQPGGPPGQPQVVTSMGTPTGHPGGMRPPMPQQPQQPINAAHYEKRPRKGLQIIDPNSGRDLSDEIYNNRQQKAPQVESTPPPSTAQTTDAPPAQAAPAVSQPSQEIQAQFAAQVAAAARGQFNSGSEKSSSASSSAGPVSKEGTPTPQIQPQQPQAATHVMHANTPTFVPQQSQPAVAVVTAHPQKQDVPPVIPPQQQVAAAPAASQQQQKPSKPQPMQQQQSKPVTPVEERRVTPERDAAPVQSAPPAATAAPKAPEPQQPEAPVPSTKKQASPPAAAIQTQAPLPQREVDTESQGRKKKGKHKARELNNKDKEGSDMDAFVVAPADNSSTSVGSPTSSVANTSTASSSSSQAETSPSVEEAKPVSAASPVVEDKAPEKEPSPAPQKKEPSPPQQTKEPSPEIKVQPPTPEVRKESKPAPTQAKPVPAKQQETVAPPTSTPSKQPESAKPVAAEAPSKRDSSPPVSKEEQKQNDKNDVVKDQDLEEGEIIDDDDDDESVNDKENKMNGDASGSEEEQLSKKRSNKKARSIELKYNYREDQWSPLNPEGKKLYDRHFLLDLQYSTESVEKPTGLPNLPDIILNEPIRKSESNPSNLSHMRGGVDFTPGYIKSINKPPASGKRGSQSGKHSRGGDPRNHNVKVISIERPLGGDVKLHSVGDKAWKPDSKKDKSGLTEEELKTRELYKKVTGILNKLTPQKFRKLVDQMIADCVIDTEDRLVGVIDIVFEKALDEPSFSVAYANLCKALSQLKVPRKDNPEQFTLFRNILLNRCQKEFEKDKTNEVDKTRMQEEVDACTTEEERAEMKLLMEEKIKKARRKSLGNIRFIGELFKLKMLTEKIMHDCILRLLKCDDQIDELECLCRLISTIGKDLDTSKNKQRMDAYFTQLQKIFDCSEKSLPSRIRFMIKDVIELRGSNWVPRRNESGPKMIDQIHKEAHDEELQRADLINRLKAEPMPTPNRNNRHGGRGSGHGQTAPVGDSDGWQTMGGKANKIDPTRMKLSRPMVSDDSIQLGPGGRPGSFGAWGRGSSGGSGKNSSQEADRPGPANRFNVLQGDGFQEQRGSTGRGLGRGLPPSRGDSREKSRMSGSRGGNMPPRLSGARSSMEQERESALSAARNISHGGPRGGSGSRNASRENSRGRDNSRDQARRAMPPPPPPAEAPAAAASTAAPTLGYDECKRKAESIMEEYLHLHDVKEAIACIKEVDSSNYADLIYHSIAFCIEKTKQARRMTGELIHDVLSRKVVTIQQFDKGVKQLMEIAEEMLLDVPMIFTYLGELFSPLIQDGSVPLTFLKDVCDPLPRRRAAQLVAEVLTEAASRLGDDVVAQQWHAAGLSWKDFLPEGEDLNAFMEKHKNLDFTLVGKEPKSPTQPKMDMAEFQDQLYKMLTRSGLTEDKDVAPVLNFINLSLTPAQRKTPAFIRALTTAVCWSAITGSGTSAAVEEANLKPRYNLLKKFLDHNNASELQALYALQALVHRLEHPPGVLRTFFDTFYDEDVVSEDAFNEWDESTDPAEMTGKGVARHSVAQFYTWLREAEDPEEQS